MGGICKLVQVGIYHVDLELKSKMKLPKNFASEIGVLAILEFNKISPAPTPPGGGSKKLVGSYFWVFALVKLKSATPQARH